MKKLFQIIKKNIEMSDRTPTGNTPHDDCAASREAGHHPAQQLWQDAAEAAEMDTRALERL